MIIGVGTDIVSIGRIRASLERHGEAFAERILTGTELDEFRAVHDGARLLAKRFAAKEACSKALGSGMREGVAWRDMGVVNAVTGYPTLHLTGGALARLETMTPSGHRAEVRLSMSDEYPFAEAVVLISAEAEARR